MEPDNNNIDYQKWLRELLASIRLSKLRLQDGAVTESPSKVTESIDKPPSNPVK